MGRSMKSRTARLCAATLTAAISVSLVSFAPGVRTKADTKGFKKTNENTRLDCTEIPKGNTVYFGKYEGNPISFEIREKSSTEFGGTTMFLSSRNNLFKRIYDDDSNVWKNSNLRSYLNNEFYSDAFSSVEKDAVFTSVKKGGKGFKAKSFSNVVFRTSQGLDGDKVFIQDAYEIGCEGPYLLYDETVISHSGALPLHSSYVGYKLGNTWYYYASDPQKNKELEDYGIWMRNPVHQSSQSVGVFCEGVNYDYYFDDFGQTNDTHYNTKDHVFEDLVYKPKYVRPAINIDLYSVLFFSNISPETDFGTKRVIDEENASKTVMGAEYKLTLKDKNINLSVPSGESVSADRNSITVPYEIKGSNANSVNQLSVLILEDKLKDTNENNNSIKYYEPLENCYSERDGSLIKKGEATIKFPPKFDIDKWGNDYHIYLLAENINGETETDYASFMEIPKVEINQGTDGVIEPVTPIPTVNPGQSGSTNNAVIPPSNDSSNTNRSSDIPSGNHNGSVSDNSSNNDAIKNGMMNLDKPRADVICGRTLSLKLTGNEASSKVVWKSSDEKTATVDSNGVVKGKKAGSVTITASVNGKKATCTLTVLYKDVTDCSKFWYEPTNVLTAKEVVKGYDKQTYFKPTNKCTRAQMVTFIWRLMGEPAPQTTKCRFKDVKQSDYFYKACIWGNEKGIVEGYKNGTFGPQIVCARRHAVTFLWRLAGKPSPKNKTNKFSDVKKADYFYNATLWASEKNILAGYSDGTFRPEGDCLRRQMVTFLYKYDKYINS